VAAAVGQRVGIPILVRSLANDLYRVRMIPRGRFRLGQELITYLDGNLGRSRNITEFLSPWWTCSEIQTSGNLTTETIRAALEHYDDLRSETWRKPRQPSSTPDALYQINPPYYTWHLSVNDELPTNCGRCRMYRAVALGVMDQIRDITNMVHACEIANEAETAIAIRRASLFNELYRAAQNKEFPDEVEQDEMEMDSGENSVTQRRVGSVIELTSDSVIEVRSQSVIEVGSESVIGVLSDPMIEVESESPPEFGPDIDGLKKWVRHKLKEAHDQGARKWTWGVDLTDEDLAQLVWGADREYELPHSGYDRSLPSDAQIFEDLKADELEDPNDQELRFEELSDPMDIPELDLPVLAFHFIQLDSTGTSTNKKSDPIINAFAKRKADATKAAKRVMQGEVYERASFDDSDSDFDPEDAFVTRRPWLVPVPPIVLPPTNIVPQPTPLTNPAMTQSDNNIPDYIHISESDEDIPDHVRMSDSDEQIPDHIHMSESDDRPEDILPPSSDESLVFDLPDEGRSTTEHQMAEHGRTISDEDAPMMVDSGSGSDIDLPGSPMDTRTNQSRFARDQATGFFTPASFSHIADDLVD
jgi:hypothetical protein